MDSKENETSLTEGNGNGYKTFENESDEEISSAGKCYVIFFTDIMVYIYVHYFVYIIIITIILWAHSIYSLITIQYNKQFILLRKSHKIVTQMRITSLNHLTFINLQVVCFCK